MHLPPACAAPTLLGDITASRSAGDYHLADGAKLVCDVEATLQADRCHVVSVGSNGDASFEAAVHRVNPSCRIDVLDGTLVGRRAALRQQLPSFVRFWPENFGPTTWANFSEVRRVDVLKIDCEGCELDSLTEWASRICTSQLLVEMHASPDWSDFGNASDTRAFMYADWERRVSAYEAVGRLHQQLVSLGYVPFHGQWNPECGRFSGVRCAELAWRRTRPCD